MQGPFGVARFAEKLMVDRLEGQLRAVELADPDLTRGMLSSPKLITSTEPNWPLGIDQQPAVILRARGAGSSVLQEVTSGYEDYDVVYDVQAEVYITAADPRVADMARYSWILAVRQVWLSARNVNGFSVLPGWSESYDDVVEDTKAAEWVSRALSVVQIVVPERYATNRTLTPVESVDVKAGYVAADEELNVPVHPAL